MNARLAVTLMLVGVTFAVASALAPGLHAEPIHPDFPLACLDVDVWLDNYPFAWLTDFNDDWHDDTNPTGCGHEGTDDIGFWYYHPTSPWPTQDWGLVTGAQDPLLHPSEEWQRRDDPSLIRPRGWLREENQAGDGIVGVTIELWRDVNGDGLIAHKDGDIKLDEAKTGQGGEFALGWRSPTIPDGNGDTKPDSLGFMIRMGQRLPQAHRIDGQFWFEAGE